MHTYYEKLFGGLKDVEENSPHVTSMDVSGELLEQYTGNLKFMRGNTHVRHLKAYGFKVHDISPLEGNVTLETLNLGKNSITDIGILSSVTSLTDLKLRFNYIESYDALKDLSLKHLDVSYNHNEYPYHDDTLLCHCGSSDDDDCGDYFKEELYDRFDYLENNDWLEPIACISSLESLSLDYMAIPNDTKSFDLLASRLVNLSACDTTNGHLRSIGQSRTLRKLNLSGCDLQDQISHLTGSVSLVYLDLRRCNLTDTTHLTTLSNLEYLNIGYNPIISLNLGSLRLHTLKMKCCLIEDVGCVWDSKTLMVLAIADNPIKNVDGCETLTSLRHLDMRDCDVSHLPTSLSKLPHLSLLDIRNNPISATSLISSH
jgi:Leucine-rich repeat (LRR) protein